MSTGIPFPKQGSSSIAVLKIMEDYRSDDTDWKHGRIFSMLYPVSDEHSDFLKKAHNLYFSENGLNPMAFKSLKRFEHEVVRMTADLLNGDENVVGVMTSGGTESLLLAVKTYRDRALKLKPWIRNPEMVLPQTAHAAFEKAAHYFGVKIRYAPVSQDQRVDIKAVKKLINRNTILLVGSAPQYPHGVIDPIAQLSELALKNNLPLHVDACVGGFILPFLEELGFPIPAFDFRLEGVTSVSADIHKYGYAAKGAAVLLYRSMDIMKYQFFISTEYPAGIYASPGILGTRGGGPIAAAWGTIQKMGRAGYLAEAKKMMEVRERFMKGLAQIPELKLVVYSDSTIVAYDSKDPKVNIYAVADYLQEKGWSVDRQQHPESIHLTLAPVHADYIDQYLSDLAAAVEFVKAHPETASSGQAAMYGMMAKIPFRGMIKSSVRSILEKMYGPQNLDPNEKTGDEKSWEVFAEKAGTHALEIKRNLDQAWSKVKEVVGQK